MKEYAALYTRTSQEKDDAFSVDSQIKACRSFALEHGLSVASEHELREDFTGKALDRPQLNVLRSLIKKKQITAVVVYAVDRLARKIGVADLLLDEFMDAGVKLYIVAWGTYVKSTPEDRLRFNFEATFSDYERRKIVERTGRGKREQIEQGIPVGTGRPLYGYIREGKRKDTRLSINEEQAEIVRKIFYWYAHERVSTQEIMRRLSGTKTPGEAKGYYGIHTIRKKGEWAMVTIYQILKDPTYIGQHLSYGHVIEVPSIVDPDLYARAQARLAEGKFQSPRNQKYEYLMARRIKCRKCDYSLDATPRWVDGKVAAFYYRCPSWRAEKAKPKCSLPGFRVDQVDECIWQWVRGVLLDPQSLRVMMEDSQKELQEQNADLTYRLTRVEDRIKEEERKLGFLVAEYAEAMAKQSNVTIQTVFRQAKENAEQLFAELQEERDKLASQVREVTISDDLIAELEEFASLTKDDLDSLPFAGRRELIETMGIYAELDEEHTQKILYIKWYTHVFRRVLTKTSSC